MCVPTDLRRKIILKLIEALKDSQSFQNIDISQIKEAVLKSEHQTFEQSKNKDEYLYFINEKMKKIHQNSAQRFDKIEKFEFSGDSKEQNFEKEDKNKIINGNIPPHVKISQMYTQEQIPQHFTNPSRKVESFAASFEQAKRTLDPSIGYANYSEHAMAKNSYLKAEHVKAGNPYTNFQPWDQQHVNYEKRNTVPYNQSPHQYNHLFNNPQIHPNNSVHSPNFQMNNRPYQPYQSAVYPGRIQSVSDEKITVGENEALGYSNSYIRKSPAMYQERSKIEVPDSRIVKDSRCTVNKNSYQDPSKQNNGFTGFSPFVYMQPHPGNIKNTDTRMSSFMNKGDNIPGYNNEKFIPRPSPSRIDSSDCAIQVESERYKINSQNIDTISKSKDIHNHPYEAYNRSAQPNYQKPSPHLYGQNEAIGARKPANFGKNSSTFEYGYTSNKNTSSNKSFVGNINPNLIDSNMKGQSDKGLPSFVSSRQSSEQTVGVQPNVKQTGRNLIFDEKKSEELFKSISEGFGFVSKRNKPDFTADSNSPKSSGDNEFEKRMPTTPSTFNSSSEMKSFDHLNDKNMSKSSNVDFNEQFTVQKKFEDNEEGRKPSQLSNSLDTFIDSALFFPFKPSDEAVLSSNSDDLEIPDELSTFLEANSLSLKEIGDEDQWKSNFKKVYKQYEEVKSSRCFPFASILEKQFKFINFVFLDDIEINRYQKIIESTPTKITKEDYLMFIDKAMEAFTEKNEGDKSIVKELNDNVAQ